MLRSNLCEGCVLCCAVPCLFGTSIPSGVQKPPLRHISCAGLCCLFLSAQLSLSLRFEMRRQALCSLLFLALLHGAQGQRYAVDYTAAAPYYSTLTPFGDSGGGDKDCPPCFNCMLPGFECLHFANCSEYNGKCNCPPGFGGDDCRQPRKPHVIYIFHYHMSRDILRQ